MLYPSRRIIDRPATWAVLIYVTIVLVIPLAGIDLFLNESSLSGGQTMWARLAVYSGPLGLFSIFLGVLFWDTMRAGGVRVLRVYKHLGYILVPFGLITLLALAFLFHPTAYWGEHEQGSSLMLFWPLFGFFILSFAVSLAAIPTVVRHYRVIFILGLAVLAVATLWEFFSGAEHSSSVLLASDYEGRATGFARDPNINAELLIALTIASVSWRKPRRLDGAIWLVAGVTVLTTLSRGGFLEYVFALGAYLAFTVRLRVKTLLQFAVLAVFFTSILVLGRAEIASFFENNEQLSTSNAQERISILTVVAEGDFGSAIEDSSGRERTELAYDYIDLIAQSPILGYGTNYTSTQPLGPHNIYLNQWVDNGVLGLGLLLMFLFASFWHFKIYKDVRGMVFVAAFALSGFFSHTLLDQRPFWVMFGLLGALAYVEYSRRAVSHSSLPKA